MHVHGRVVGRKVERGEVVPVGFHLGPDRHGEAEAPEDLDDLIDYPGDRMLGPDPAAARGHREINAGLLARPPLGLQGLAPAGERLLEAGLELVDRGAVRLPLLRRARRHRLERHGDRTILPPEDRDDLRGKRIGPQPGNGSEPGKQSVEVGVAGRIGHAARE